MDEPGSTPRSSLRIWLKRVGIGFGILVLVLAAFHRPILHAVVRKVATKAAAGQNLKIDFRVAGSVVGGIELRSIHAVATGPSALQSLDADLLRADYSLWGLLRHGASEFLQDVELRNATVVLDPAKAPPKIEPEKNQKFTLPAFFPDRLTLSNVNVRMASQPEDLIIEGLNLVLNPKQAGELRIAKLQLASGKTWTGVKAQTTYENRNLFLRNLTLDEQTKLDVVNVDASQIGSNQLAVGLKGTVAGGKIDTTMSLGAQEGSVETKIDLNVADTSLDTVRKYLQPAAAAQKEDTATAIADATEAAAKEGADAAGAETVGPAGPIPPGINGDVRNLSIKLAGRADQPNSWNGTIRGQIENLEASGVTFDRADIDMLARDGRAEINHLELTRGSNKITMQGAAELPETVGGLGHQPGTIQLRAQLPSIGEITAGMPQPITGSAEVNGQIKVGNGTISADISIAGGPIDFGQGTVHKAIVNVRATKRMPPPEEKRPYFDGLTSEIGFDLTEVRASGFAIDAVAGELRTNGPNVTVQQLIANRGDNRLTVRGEYLLPADIAQAKLQPGAIDIALVAPQVGDYWEGDSPDRVTGSLQLWAQSDFRGGVGAGSFNVYGENLRARNLVVPELSASGSTAGKVVYLNDLTAQLNKSDFIRANGTAGIEAPYPYSGTLALSVADLGTFESFLATLRKPTELAGALAINWQGSGAISTFKNTGTLKLILDNGRFADLEDLEANIDANYTPEELNVPIVYVSSDKLMFQAIMQAKDGKLEMTKVQVIQGEAKYADGYVAVPFVWENVGTDRPLFTPDGEVLVNFQTENLDINKLTRDLGIEIPVRGLANIKFDAQGTLENVRATLDLQLTGLRSEKLEDFTPATFALNARVENNQLLVNGKLEQTRIQPIAITANVPLPVAEIIANKKIDEQTPLRANVQMPRSSVNFVRQFVPALQRIDGNAALDVNVGGTIARPVFSGSADMTINAARFSNATLPALTGFTARLVFTDDTLTLQQFRGDLAGGPFTVAGRITFPKLTEPTFDLQLRADAVLVARNDDLTARADANLRVVGPLMSAAVTGEVALTNSQFLKNLDLIPIGVPGRPPPGPKPPSDRPALSFPDPPLRDWTFDVAVKTKDPFMIRGNLANGGAIVDMRLTGTGLEPKLNGSVRLQNVEATLPFSRLEITQGFLYFNPEDPFNPGLDLQGTSLIRDYTVRVYVYGTANKPEAVFTSEPPLPQEEIISLLATGTTREELLSGSNVLAGRAVMLLGQQLYQKVFKKGQSTKSNSVFDRLQVDIGNVDPRTGQQTATARYRVTDQVLLIGDIGVEGDFRGTVKYLLRFR